MSGCHDTLYNAHLKKVLNEKKKQETKMDENKNEKKGRV